MAMTLMELAKIIKKEFQIRYNLVLPIITSQGIIKKKATSVPDEKYTISNNKLKSLGFTPTYSIKQGVNELFDYLENNQEYSHK